MERSTQALETMIRFWVQREEKMRQEYLLLKHRRSRFTDIEEDRGQEDFRKRDAVLKRFLS